MPNKKHFLKSEPYICSTKHEDGWRLSSQRVAPFSKRDGQASKASQVSRLPSWRSSWTYMPQHSPPWKCWTGRRFLERLVRKNKWSTRIFRRLQNDNVTRLFRTCSTESKSSQGQPKGPTFVSDGVRSQRFRQRLIGWFLWFERLGMFRDKKQKRCQNRLKCWKCSKRSFVEVCGMGEISWTGFGMAGQKSREVKKPTEKSILIWTWKYLSIKSGRNWKEPRPIWNDFWRNQTATDWTFWNEWLLLEPRSPKFVMTWTFYLYKYPDKGSFLNLECDVCKTHLWCSLRLGVFHQPLTAFQQAFDPLVNNPLFTLIPQILWRLYSACFLSWTNNKNNSIWWRPFCSLHKSSSLIRFRCPLLK